MRLVTKSVIGLISDRFWPFSDWFFCHYQWFF